MRAFLIPKAHRFLAVFLLAGVFTIAGHHFAIVASADAHIPSVLHHSSVPVSNEERQEPSPIVEAHSPTPIIQKFQLQKQLEVASSFSNTAFFVDSQYRETAIEIHTDDRLPARLPLDLKTAFLN